MSDMVALFMPDGRVLALAPEALRAALAAGDALGMAPQTPSHVTNGNAMERLVDSSKLAELIGVHSTTVEAMAQRSEIPSIRIGRILRFEPSAVKAALKQR